MLIVLIIIGISCNKEDNELEVNEIPAFSLEQPDIIGDENYKIYSAAIESLTKRDTILIAQSSLSLTDTLQLNTGFSRIRQELPEIGNDILISLKNINQSTVLFDEKFEVDQKEIILISSEEISYVFSLRLEETSSLFQEYSDIYRFSKIAFNEDKTKATIESSTSGSGGQGHFIYLEKNDNNWKVKKVIMLWLA